MATTTNYGWDTPDDTDLVKDGAAAIRTLGSSIDTTTKNLNPQTTTGALAYRSATANVNTALPIGTNGQILAVSGGVPAWINNDQGDITEVQAGTGISVASGTGPIPVVTNTVATAFDAKGDLIGGTGADTFAKLSVGANDTVLTADSSQATGLKWATAASASGPAFRAFLSGADQSFSVNTNTKVALNGETFDTDSCFDSTTNYRFTPNKSGYYQLSANISFQGTNATTVKEGFIYKNGSAEVKIFSSNGSGVPGANFNGGSSTLMYFNGTTDYAELFVFDSDATSRAVDAGSVNTSFCGVWIRS